MASLGDIAARGAATTIITQIARFGAQFLSLIVLARLLSPEDFGLVAMVVAIVGVAEVLKEFGLSSAAIQAQSLSRQQQSNLWWINFFIGTFCAVVTIIGAPLISALYGDDRLTLIAVALASTFAIGGATTQFRASLSRDMRFRALNTSELTSTLFGIVVAVVCAWAGLGYWSLIVQQIVTSALLLAMNALQSSFRPCRPRRGAGTRPLLTFGIAVAGTQLVSYVAKNADKLMIGLKWGAGPVGLYSRAHQLVMLPLNQLNVPITRVALPVLSRIQDDTPLFERYIKKSQLVACYLTTSIFAVVAGLATPLVAVLLGPNWDGIAPILSALAIGGVFRSLSQVSYWIYLARGKASAQFRFYLVGTPFLIIAMACGLPWGAAGVAVGHAIGYALYWLAGLYRACQVTNIGFRPLILQALRSCGLVALPVGGICYMATFLWDSDVIQIATGLGAAALYVSLVALLVKPIRRDAVELHALLKRALGRSPGKHRLNAASVG